MPYRQLVILPAEAAVSGRLAIHLIPFDKQGDQFTLQLRKTILALARAVKAGVEAALYVIQAAHICTPECYIFVVKSAVHPIVQSVQVHGAISVEHGCIIVLAVPGVQAIAWYFFTSFFWFFLLTGNARTWCQNIFVCKFTEKSVDKFSTATV